MAQVSEPIDLPKKKRHFFKFQRDIAAPAEPAGRCKERSLLYRLFHSEDEERSNVSDSEESEGPSTLSETSLGQLDVKRSHSFLDFFRPHPSKGDKLQRNVSELSLNKYGWVEKQCIGRGSSGVVRVCHASSEGCEKLYAVKEFRRKGESERCFLKKVTAEFCIGHSLHHENVIETVDLVQNEKKEWCEVMEYCAGGDLCTRIQTKHLSADEADRYFVQLIHGVDYIHQQGVAHRDLKPENLMLDDKGALKITDFGEAEVFKTPYEKVAHKSRRCCGSEPYMAPEEFTEKEFDPRPIDIFACGIIYMAMVHNKLPWRKPCVDDPCYRSYLDDRQSFKMLQRLRPGPRELMGRILHPCPEARASMQEIISNPWFQDTEALIRR